MPRKSIDDKKSRRPSADKGRRRGSAARKSAESKGRPDKRAKRRSSKERLLDAFGLRNTTKSRDNSASGASATGNPLDKIRAKRAEEWMSRWKEEEIGIQWEDLQQTYQKIPEGYTTSVFDSVEAKKKRYAQVKCLDQTRVKLATAPLVTHDFIHASYVSRAGGGNKFILATGPTKDTVIDFWSMIVQQKIIVVVMLCQLEEDGKSKCARYFPEEKNERLVLKGTTPGAMGKDVIVHVEEKSRLTIPRAEAEAEVIEHRNLSVTYPDKLGPLKRQVQHYLYRTWPDQGVPASRLGIPYLQQLVQSTMEETVHNHRATPDTPVLIHCSAGIGRSGTFAAIDNLLRSITCDNPEVPDVPALIRALRKERFLAVQTVTQYYFIYATAVAELKRQSLIHSSHKIPALPNN